MSEFDRNNVYGAYDEQAGLKAYITKVFTHMGIGLTITAAVAYLFYHSLVTRGTLARIVFFSDFAFFIQIGLLISQFILVISLNAAITRLSKGACNALFLTYAALSGVTFGVIPLAYGVGVVFQAFVFAAILFISCAVIGHVTNVDLTKYQGILLGGLFALIIASVVSIFIPALRNNLLIAYLGLFIFMIYTAFDIQRIKQFYYMTADGTDQRDKLAIYGALQLYLDFVNMFLYLLRILGRRRR
ncbi:MAG: Bax inhibitor-1/YccA family protein [Solobacterium sp.]|nr:Bax inhibitor-1/YccA family protein [Solobacterium sp.]